MSTPHTETAMSAALSRAGLNTAESRLRMLATDALKKHHGNIDRAIKTFEAGIDGDRAMIRESHLHYLKTFRLPDADHAPRANQNLPVGDRQPNGDERGQRTSADQNPVAASSPHDGVGHGAFGALGSGARPVVEPSAAQTAADVKVKALSALTVFDRELTHTGRRWGNIFYRELDSMTDDGELARAVKVHIGSLRGDDRHKTIRELMTPREFYGVLRKLGRPSHAA